MSDKIHRFHLENLNVRGEWVSLSTSWQEIQKTADYPLPVKLVLGEALVAISLLAESLKFDGSLVLQIQGTAPVTMLVVQASSDGAIRGIARWQGEIADNSDFKALFGAGTMVISVENNSKPGAQQGERYQSMVSLQGASLAACFSDYFSQSEQLNTEMWLAVNETSAAGLLLQSLPTKNTEEGIADSDGWDHAKILADTLSNDKGKEELLTLDSNTLLHRLYNEDDLRLYDNSPLRFECSCSQQKIEDTIFSLGAVEANDIVAEQGNISIDCEFCNQHYELDKVDIMRIFTDDTTLGTTNGSGSVH
ncbi:MAG: Hsp33 family molecular chaperone HslO [Cocleimonas sp.]